MKLKNYLKGQWVEGNGDEVRLLSAVNGELVGISDTGGLEYSSALDYARTVGYQNLSTLSFYKRGEILKHIALYLLERKKKYYELSYQTGATHSDSWVDIEGGLGTFFTYSGLAKRMLPNTPFWVEDQVVKTSTEGTHLGIHMLTPSEGVSVQINAYNFPVWGMLEKLSTSLLAGVPSIVKPATPGCYLTHAVFSDIIESGLLPEGALQLICGEPGDLLSHVQDGDSVLFTGSAKTGRYLKSLPNIAAGAVRFNMEADSLNCSILGPDAVPGTIEFDLFIKEVQREITSKAGQKCTAIRRILVPSAQLEQVAQGLAKALDQVKIGSPLNRQTRMGSLVGMQQREEVEKKLEVLGKSTELIYDGKQELIEADFNTGAFMTPKLFLNTDPFQTTVTHEVEAFGPVSTLMPYDGAGQAAKLAKMGRGSLVGSVISNDKEFASELTWKMASSHGRVYLLNRDNANEATGHGSPLPTLNHGGPGRAGGGEELGGLSGLHFFLQKTAVQGSPDLLRAVSKIHIQGAKRKLDAVHPFQKYFEEVEIGDSLETAGRTITQADIVNFSNVSWDHFYAHTDKTSLSGTIFDRVVAHGYFILSAAAGLFVSAKKGPVIANYGLEEASFFKPVYAGDTIKVFLTAKEKVNKGVKGKNIPSGVVKWLVEVYNQREEMVCVATILTLVAKKSPFLNLKREDVKKWVGALQSDQKPLWGVMSPQHMLEHLEYYFKMSVGAIAVENELSEVQADEVQEWLYNFKPVPRGLRKEGELDTKPGELIYESFKMARQAFLDSFIEFQMYFNEFPERTHPHPNFGILGKEGWELFHQKHLTHHFAQFGLVEATEA